MKRPITLLLLLALTLAGVFLSQQVSSASGTPGKQATFSRDVAPSFYRNCAECHRSGEGAPFSVLRASLKNQW